MTLEKGSLRRTVVIVGTVQEVENALPCFVLVAGDTWLKNHTTGQDLSLVNTCRKITLHGRHRLAPSWIFKKADVPETRPSAEEREGQPPRFYDERMSTTVFWHHRQARSQWTAWSLFAWPGAEGVVTGDDRAWDGRKKARRGQLCDRITGLTESERLDHYIRTIRALVSFCKEQGLIRRRRSPLSCNQRLWIRRSGTAEAGAHSPILLNTQCIFCLENMDCH